MLKMMPNAAGTNLTMDANGTQEFDFTFTPGQGELWPDGQQYVIAFVQKATGDREILQGGTNLNEVFARLEMSTAKWQYITKGESKSGTVTVTNPGKSAIEVEMSITNAADLTQAGWTVSLSNDVLALPAGGSKTVTVTAKAPNRASFAGILVGAKPVNLAGGIARESAVEHGYLTEGARVAVWAGASEGAVVSAIGALASSHSTDVVYIPLAQEIVEAFDPTAFDAAIFPAGFDGRFNMVAFTPIMEAMQSSGKGVWMHAPVGLVVTNSNLTVAGYPEMKAWFDRMGVSLKETKNRLNAANTKTLSFKADGVAGDEIGDKWTATVNRSQYDETSPVNWPFYASATDIMNVSPTAPTVGFTYSDGVKSNIVGVRSTALGKAVYTTFGPELIPTESERNTLTQKILDWLLKGNAPGLTLSTNTLNFGEVVVDAMKEASVKITNPGSAPLEISSIAIAGIDTDAFTVKSGGTTSGAITVQPKGDHTVVVTFKPGFAGTFSARLEIESNIGSTSTVALSGKGADNNTSVETEATTPSGALSLRLVGSNPVTTASAVELTVNGAGTEDVTLTLVDVAGRTVGTIFNGTLTAGSQRFDLNAADLNSGMYTVVATTGAERATITVVASR
ncbi:MAG: choice-of-anchor D domain-containing protein [Candidatus Kapabacteria bacterium]|nr:choice-of-anchor D domain-containing protein [Candidatus Kapabacteria bacterium]